jgi:hypothetical protein
MPPDPNPQSPNNPLLKQQVENLEKKLQDYITKTDERIFELQPLKNTVRVSQGQQVRVAIGATKLEIDFAGVKLKGSEISIGGPIVNSDELIFKTGDASIVMKKDGSITIQGNFGELRISIRQSQKFSFSPNRP